jgi:hypothetical protein
MVGTGSTAYPSLPSRHRILAGDQLKILPLTARRGRRTRSTRRTDWSVGRQALQVSWQRVCWCAARTHCLLRGHQSTASPENNSRDTSNNIRPMLGRWKRRLGNDQEILS